MKIAKSIEHVCKYFTEPWRNRRSCKYCNKSYYNYSGKWEPELTYNQFVAKWSENMGNGTVDLKIETGAEFEFNCYESWSWFINVSVFKNNEWHTVKKCRDFNDADVDLRKIFAQTP